MLFVDDLVLVDETMDGLEFVGEMESKDPK